MGSTPYKRVHATGGFGLGLRDTASDTGTKGLTRKPTPSRSHRIALLFKLELDTLVFFGRIERVMKIDIDKAIAENEKRIDESMARHRELIAQIDKETAELNLRICAVLAEHGETLREIFTEKK